ncbi:MAG TPA: hypothetical protein PLQ36_03745 [Candidatus Gracilibacteria bacterium]|nr:hypothetical protein [Candidatus Gracilibacteria bacterium]
MRIFSNGETLLSVRSKINQNAQETQELLVSGENIKTVNGESILGSGNISAGDMNKSVYDPRNISADCFNIENITGTLDGGTF